MLYAYVSISIQNFPPISYLIVTVNNCCYLYNFFFRILLRLYWFPTKVLYSSCYVCVQLYPHGPFYLSFNIMLILLYAMQVYWFSFIVRLLVRMVLKGKVEVKDTRENEEEEEAYKRSKTD